MFDVIINFYKVWSILSAVKISVSVKSYVFSSVYEPFDHPPPSVKDNTFLKM